MIKQNGNNIVVRSNIMRFCRLKLDTAATYHVMSRIVDKQLVIKDLEKRYLRGLLSRLEVFSDCESRTYTILDNHFLCGAPHNISTFCCMFLRGLNYLIKRSSVGLRFYMEQRSIV